MTLWHQRDMPKQFYNDHNQFAPNKIQQIRVDQCLLILLPPPPPRLPDSLESYCHDWGRRHTVGVAEISVDPNYSLSLPELLNDETKQLEVKKLIFLILTLSMNGDDLLYMMGKVNEEDETAWVITVDMKRVALEALVPISPNRVLLCYNLLPVRLSRVLLQHHTRSTILPFIALCHLLDALLVFCFL